MGTTGGLPLRGEFLQTGTARNKGYRTANVNAFSRALLRDLTAVTEPPTESSDPSIGANLVEEILRGTTRETFSRLNVIVFYIDFDGIEYGIAQEIFAFKPYEGVMDIRTLQAYPTQFSTPKQSPVATTISPEVDKYLVRGNKFIDYTSFSHLSFDGLAAEKSRQEINSAVIVDFHIGFQEYSHSFSDGDSVVPTLSTSQLGSLGWPHDVTSTGWGAMQFYSSRCSQPWCQTCLIDGYPRIFIDQERILHRTIMDQLEEHVPSKLLPNSESLAKFRNYMEKNDFIRLLPGTVPAFALRNRKWCMSHTRQVLTMSGLTPGHSQSCLTSSSSRSSSSLVTGANSFCPTGTRK